MNRIRKNWPILVIAIIYSVGISGFLIPSTRETFASASWASILASFLLLVYCERSRTPAFWAVLAGIGAAGYFAEVAGVHSGLLFGEYIYGRSLGFQLLEVPLMIAVNWALLVYLSSYIARSVVSGELAVVLVAAALMTALDVLIEPFAIRFDLWTWAGGEVPLKNYGMWFILSALFNWAFLRYVKNLQNPLAVPLAVVMLIFFLVIDLVVIW